MLPQQCPRWSPNRKCIFGHEKAMKMQEPCISFVSLTAQICIHSWRWRWHSPPTVPLWLCHCTDTYYSAVVICRIMGLGSSSVFVNFSICPVPALTQKPENAEKPKLVWTFLRAGVTWVPEGRVGLRSSRRMAAQYVLTGSTYSC